MDRSLSKVSGVAPIGSSRPAEHEPYKGRKSNAVVPVSVSKHIHTSQDAKRAERQGEYIPISDEQLIKAIEQAIRMMEGNETTLDFSVHERTKQMMVKVLNKDTGELIREIPPERSLDFLAKVWEKIGILVDERR